jgi:hypothetical protein
MLSVCLCIPPIKFKMPELLFMIHGMYNMASEPISAVHFINPSQQSVCPYVYPTTVARQRLCKNVTTATREELLEASFSMRSVSYKRSMRLVLPRTSCNIIFSLMLNSLKWPQHVRFPN